MKIAILGCGYVGRAAAEHWRGLGYTVTVSTRNPEKVEDLKLIADKVVVLKNSIEPLLVGQEAVLLSVAPDNSEIDNYREAYLENALALKKLLPGFSALKQVLYTGTTSVYGDHHGDWVSEESTLKGQNKRIEILIETEKTLLAARTIDRKVCVFRLGEIIGPGREVAIRLKNHVGKPFMGTGENYTNFSHLNTIVEGLTFALEKKLDGVYNLCEEIHLPRREFYDALCKELGLPETLWDPTQFSHHAGNKKVSSQKFRGAVKEI